MLKTQRIPLSILEGNSPTMHPLEFQRQWGLTQFETAIALNASLDTIKAWSSQRRIPSGKWFKIAGQKNEELKHLLINS